MKKKQVVTEIPEQQIKIEKSISKFYEKKIALQNLAKAIEEKQLKDQIKPGSVINHK
jgi:hypothetical protein